MDVIVTDRCQGCGACLLTCPEHAIRPQIPDDPADPADPANLSGPPRPPRRPHRPLRVVRSLCTECLECIEICPADAIEVLAIHDAEEGP